MSSTIPVSSIHGGSIIVAVAVCLSYCFTACAAEAEESAFVPNPSVAATLLPHLADPGGVRASLAARGIQFGLNYIGEVLSNTQGGIEEGTIYDGQFEFYVDADLRWVGWGGLSFHVNGYQLHGEGITATRAGNLNALSSIEALATTRLFEFWFEQKLWNERASIRIGQLAVDTEFMLADGADQFISASFGWPTITASNLPSGGTAYPFAAPGVRVEFAPNEQLTIRVGLYNDDPAGPGTGDPQLRNRYGLNFRLHDSPFIIGEAAVKYNLDVGSRLPGALKVGAWLDLAEFDDLRFDIAGRSLADPVSSGLARTYRGNQSVYAVVDQQLYRLPGEDGSKGLSAFARFMVAPSDRNLVDLNIDGGLKFSGFISGRPSDSFGIAAAYAGISDHQIALDRDAVTFGSNAPLHSDEVLVELSYIAEIVPGWTLQPDFQYVWNPGGNAADETGTADLEDTAILGVRTTINY